MASLSFKPDPSSLAKLQARGDNITGWNASWTLAFKYVKLWDYVSGKNERKDGDIRKAQDDGDTKTRVMLLSVVHSGLTTISTTYYTPAEA
jgi:hypothetical protein